MIRVTAPDWDLQQLIHQLQLSINSTEQIKNKKLVLWNLMDMEQGPSFAECSIYVIILRTFMNYISDNVDMLKSSSQEVSNFINTSIIINNNIVTISYDDPALIKKMQNKLDEEGYKIIINQE